MLLRHATPRRNLRSIQRRGLLCSRSLGRLAAVWLVAPSQTSWAVLHTVRRHGGDCTSVSVLELDVPRRLLRRYKRGLWYCTTDLDWQRVRRVLTFAEVSESPVTDMGAT